MIKQKVVLHLYITDLCNIQFLFAAFQRYSNKFFFLYFYSVKRSSHTLRKREIRNRLQHVIQSIYLISLNRILRHIGYKYNNNVLVQFADFFGSFHSVQKSHLNVHENKIIIRGIIRHDVFSIPKFRNQKFQSVFFFVSIQVSSQRFQIMRIIFHCCNTKHVHPPCLLI